MSMRISASAVVDFVGRALSPTNFSPSSVSTYVPGYGMTNSSATFDATVRAYTGNEIVAAAINLLTSSAAEPHIIGRKYRRNRRDVTNEKRYLNAVGIPNRAGRKQIDAILVRNGFWEEVDERQHPLVKILNNPNPYMSRGQFWGQIVMDRYLAGNAYVLKARYADGVLPGAVAELWRLRPDRVKPIPGNMEAGEPYVKEYEFTIDVNTKRKIATEDILHFKTLNPLDPYVGLSPVATLLPRVAIDTYMRNFLQTFYQRGGAGVGASLNIKGKMDQQQKDDLRARFRRMFSGGQYDVLVTSAEDVQYVPFGLDRGLRDALPKEIDAVNEARIAMVFGIPGSILGLLIGYESSSYANKRSDWQVFWDLTMTPLLSDFDDVLNLGLVPEFGGIDDVEFDLSDIRALQEDEDKMQARARDNFTSGGWSLQEYRQATGVTPEPPTGELFYIPSGGQVMPAERLGEEPEPPPAPAPVLPSGEEEAPTALLTMPRQLGPGRPRLEDDESARAIHQQAMNLRNRSPHLSWAHISARVGVDERTLRKYRSRFDS
jgi:HK97 family phage portal protein